MIETSPYTVHRATIGDTLRLGQVSEWTQLHKDKMLPLDMYKLWAMSLQGLSFIALNEEEEVASHAGVTFQWAEDFWEVGGVVSNPSPDILRHGAATTVVRGLVDIISAEYPEVTIFALVNGLSSGLFHKLGWEPVAHQALPENVWSGCASCSKVHALVEGQLCCDTPVVPPPIKQRINPRLF